MLGKNLLFLEVIAENKHMFRNIELLNTFQILLHYNYQSSILYKMNLSSSGRTIFWKGMLFLNVDCGEQTFPE
jgi:hypothetical protein